MDSHNGQGPDNPAQQILDHLQQGLPKPAPGRVIDIAAETKENPELDLLQSDDIEALLPRRKPASYPKPPVVDRGQLPGTCVGAGCLAASILKAFVAKCGADRDCWQRSLLGLEGQEKLPG